MCIELVPTGYNPDDCCGSCHSEMEYADEHEDGYYPYDSITIIYNKEPITVYSPCCGSMQWIRDQGFILG
jgi:hypothetical protein